jgi:hypothetical protein
MTIRELIEQKEMYEEDIKQMRIKMNALQDNVYKNVLKLTDLNFEMWNNIKGYEGLHIISNFGNVKNIKTSKILKPKIKSQGYKFVGLYCNGKYKNMLIHRLVAIQYIYQMTKISNV